MCIRDRVCVISDTVSPWAAAANALSRTGSAGPGIVKLTIDVGKKMCIRDRVGEVADGLDAVEAMLIHAQLAFTAQSLDIVDGDLVVPDEAGIDLVDLSLIHI